MIKRKSPWHGGFKHFFLNDNNMTNLQNNSLHNRQYNVNGTKFKLPISYTVYDFPPSWNLSKSEQEVLSLLIRLSKQKGYSYASAAKLSEMLLMKDRKFAERNIKKLIDKELIKIKKKTPSGNEYELTDLYFAMLAKDYEKNPQKPTELRLKVMNQNGSPIGIKSLDHCPKMSLPSQRIKEKLKMIYQCNKIIINIYFHLMINST